MGCRATGDGAGLLSRLDAGVVTQPAHPIIARYAPEAIVDPFERAHQRGPGRNGQVCSVQTARLCHQALGLVNGQTAAQVRQLPQ